MKTRNFFTIVIVIIFSVYSLSSAQSGRRLLTKAQFDSVRTELNALPDSEPIKRYAAFFHDLTLVDGHREYVSLHGGKNSILNKIFTKIDSLKSYMSSYLEKVDAGLTATNADLAKTNADIVKADNKIKELTFFVEGLDETINLIQLVVAEDDTEVAVSETKTETKTMSASELAMQKIKENNAARRAAKK